MEKHSIVKYIGKRVFIILGNGFKYTFDFEKNNIEGNTISITDKYNEPVDFDISDIKLIKLAVDNGRRQYR